VTPAQQANSGSETPLFVSLGPAAQIVLNYATYQNTFMDDSKSARLNRVMYAMYFWF